MSKMRLKEAMSCESLGFVSAGRIDVVVWVTCTAKGRIGPETIVMHELFQTASTPRDAGAHKATQ